MSFTLCLSTEWFQLTAPSIITFIEYHPFQNAGKTNIYYGEHLHLGSYKQNVCPKNKLCREGGIRSTVVQKGTGFFQVVKGT